MTANGGERATGDVAVVGGGIIGLCCAFALRRAGARVTVLERDHVGAGASWGNAGWIVPSLSMPLAAPGMLRLGLRHALDPRGALVLRPALDPAWLRWLWQFRRSCSQERFHHAVETLLALNETTLAELDSYRAAGVEFEQHSTGILIVGRTRAGLDWFEQLFHELRALGLEGVIDALDGDAARELDPALGPAVGAALRTSIDRHVLPESLVTGLAAHLRRAGVAVEEGRPVEGLARRGGRWELRGAWGTVAADAVVLATGAAANELLAGLGLRLPIVGAKGYAITLPGSGTVPRHSVYLCEPKVGLSPFRSGLRIAGIFELPGRTTDPIPRRIRQLVDDTVPYLSGWSPAPGERLEGWAGLRPATPDGLPFIGPVPGNPGVYVAAGHNMIGMTLGPATGTAVAGMIATGHVPEELRPFALDRRI